MFYPEPSRLLRPYPVTFEFSSLPMITLMPFSFMFKPVQVPAHHIRSLQQLRFSELPVLSLKEILHGYHIFNYSSEINFCHNVLNIN